LWNECVHGRFLPSVVLPAMCANTILFSGNISR
jgi:hypothetical protein